MAATASNSILLFSSALYPFPDMHPNNRKIRFAPLPDPRRSVFVSDDGSELPLPDTPACPPLLADLPIPIHDPDSDSLDSSSTRRSSRGSSATTPTASATNSVSSLTQDTPTKTVLPPVPNPLLTAKLQKHHDASAKPKPKSLFRPFLRRPNTSTPSLSSSPSASSSTSTLHPHPKHAPFPRINLSSPSLGLFRVAPRPHPHDDDHDAPDSKGGGLISLARWSGSSSSVNKRSNSSSNGYPHSQAIVSSPLNPLSRTSSIQSVQSNGTQTPFGSTASLPLTRTDSGRIHSTAFPRSSASSSLPGRRPSTASGSFSSSQLSLGSTTTTSTSPNSSSSPPRKGKGTRMLNGRVYGHRRGASSGGNPFANARDEADPEFVEWGYGGMGSVRNGAGVGNNVWGRLQREGTVLGGGTDEGKKEGDGGGGGGLDDGSGMGWVRKRREERERLKKEKEEQERRDAETKPLEVVVEDDKTVEKVFEKSGVEQLKDRPDTAATITLAAARSASATPTPTPPSSAVDAPSKPSDEIDEHGTRAVTVPAPAMGRRHASHGHGRTHSKESFHEAVTIAHDDKKSVTLSVEVAEKPGDEADAEESEDSSEDEGSLAGEETEEDEEEEEEAEKRRKTALGAGVEKITRHK